jgi:hypothetical protein
MNKMRDQLLLLMTGLAFAGIAYLLFAVAGEYTLVIFMAIGLFVTSADNARLRRELKKLKEPRAES